MVSSVEYRQCVVDEKRALFHRWVEKDQIILLTGCILRRERAEAIRQQFEKDFIVPSGMTIEKAQYVLGIIEFEDGTIREVIPANIKFLDSDSLFSKEERSEKETR